MVGGGRNAWTRRRLPHSEAGRVAISKLDGWPRLAGSLIGRPCGWLAGWLAVCASTLARMHRPQLLSTFQKLFAPVTSHMRNRHPMSFTRSHRLSTYEVLSTGLVGAASPAAFSATAGRGTTSLTTLKSRRKECCLWVSQSIGERDAFSLTCCSQMKKAATCRKQETDKEKGDSSSFEAGKTPLDGAWIGAAAAARSWPGGAWPTALSLARLASQLVDLFGFTCYCYLLVGLPRLLNKPAARQRIHWERIQAEQQHVEEQASERGGVQSAATDPQSRSTAG